MSLYKYRGGLSIQGLDRDRSAVSIKQHDLLALLLGQRFSHLLGDRVSLRSLWLLDSRARESRKCLFVKSSSSKSDPGISFKQTQQNWLRT